MEQVVGIISCLKKEKYGAFLRAAHRRLQKHESKNNIITLSSRYTSVLIFENALWGGMNRNVYISRGELAYVLNRVRV